MTLCDGCFGTLNHVNKELKQDKKIKEKVNGYLKEIGMEFKGTTKVKHLIHLLSENIGVESARAIMDAVQNRMNPLRVAQHSGCHIIRPLDYVGSDDPENPTVLKKLINVTGAECLNYFDEMECCGAPTLGVNNKLPLQWAREKLDHIKAVNAQALITVCPFCHMIYDLNQPRVEKTFNEKFGIPVLHYTQLLGLAMGFSPEELAFKQLKVDPSKIVTK